MSAVRERVADGPGGRRPPGRDRHRGRRRAGGGGAGRARRRAGAADADPGAGPGRTPTRPPTSGGRWPSSGSGPSPRTSCRTRSSWPAGRSSWSTQQGQNERRRATEKAEAAGRIDAEGRRRAQQRGCSPMPEADATRAVGGSAEADAEAARLAAYRDLDAVTLIGLALQGAGRQPAPDRHADPHPRPADAASLRPAGRRPGRGVSLHPRVVVVHRRTELDELIARHGTRAQAAFFLRTRGRSLEEVEARARRPAGRLRRRRRRPSPSTGGGAGSSGPTSAGSCSAPRTSSSPSARTGWSPTWPSTSTASS